MKEFYLSTEVALSLRTTHATPAERWMQIPHSGIVRPAYVLLAGDCLTIADGLCLTPESRLLLKYGAAHENLSADGATLSAEITVAGANHPLAELPVAADKAGLCPREALIDLGGYAGSACTLNLLVGPGPGHDPRGDWLAIYECAIADAEDMPNVRARAFRSERSANELAHFAHVYDHQIYRHGTARIRSASLEAAPSIVCHSLTSLTEATAAAFPALSPDVQVPDFPAPVDLPAQLRDPYHYAHHLLNAELRSTAPNFSQRLKDKGREDPLRILSLCSGAARIEATFAARADVRTQWTLMDLSESLLLSAVENFPANIVPELIVGDLNQISDFGQRFDIILCVSGLHHIVELEKVIAFIQTTLVEDGEFWSIGEAIGRNGNRLWSNDYVVANTFFRSLPERLRHNSASLSLDSDLPNTDCAGATFEGIRSEDIEPLLNRYLDPVHVYRRNCFLWRLVDLAYAGNYDLANPEDVLWLQRGVAAELAHFRAGGRPTELHGVYRHRAA